MTTPDQGWLAPEDWAPPDPATAAGRRDRSGPAVLLTCLLVVGLLAVLTAHWQEAPIAYVDAVVGERAEGRRYDAEVRSVVLTRAARTPTSTDPMSTPQRFVVVDLVFDVKLSGARFTKMRLRTTDGSLYAPRDELSTLESCEPGFTAYGHAGFEVPNDRVAGAVLVLGPEVGSFKAYDTALRFDLGLTRQTPVQDLAEIGEGRQEVTR